MTRISGNFPVAICPLVLASPFTAHGKGALQNCTAFKLLALVICTAALAVAGFAWVTAPAVAAPHSAKINVAGLNCKPAPCVLPNVESAGGANPVNETAIAASPIDNAQLIMGANDFNCGSMAARRTPKVGSDSINYVGVSHWTTNNGGKTWSGGCDALAGNATIGVADPILGYDLSGAAYEGSIQLAHSGYWEIVVAKSTDNGTTWGTPVVVMQRSGGNFDKPWLEIDNSTNSPNSGTLYISAMLRTPSGGTTNYVAHSTDGGATWTPVAASPVYQAPTFAIASDFAVGADGTAYLTYDVCTQVNSACAGTTETIYLQKSADGGNTWSPQIAIGTAIVSPVNCAGGEGLVGCLPNTGERVVNVPAIAIDTSSGPYAGYLYLADYNWTGSFMQVQVTTSIDGGNTWGTPVPVAPPSDTHDQFFPWLNVSNTGLVGVTWLDRRNDPNNVNYEAFGTWSKDGGQKFARNMKLSSQPSNPFNDGFNGTFMGDYTGNVWVRKKLYAAWTDTRNGKNSQAEIGGLKR